MLTGVRIPTNILQLAIHLFQAGGTARRGRVKVLHSLQQRLNM